MSYRYQVAFIAHTNVEVWLDDEDPARAKVLAQRLVKYVKPHWEAAGVQDVREEIE